MGKFFDKIFGKSKKKQGIDCSKVYVTLVSTASSYQGLEEPVIISQYMLTQKINNRFFELFSGVEILQGQITNYDEPRVQDAKHIVHYQNNRRKQYYSIEELFLFINGLNCRKQAEMLVGLIQPDTDNTEDE